MLVTFLLFLLIGSAAGFLAGLLGIGGGLLVVPALLMLLAWLHFPPESLMHVVVATSLAIMVITASVSVYSHHHHGSIDWSLVLSHLPGTLVGVLLGSVFAHHLTSRLLEILFAGFVLFLAVRMFLAVAPKPGRQLPNVTGRNGVGFLIGLKSGVLGLGGGAVTIPYLVRCNVPMQRAAACSSAFSFTIALAGTLSYAVLAWQASSPAALPHCLGYVYWPALVSVALGSSICARLGASLTQRLPASVLKRIFAVFLLVVASKMLLGIGI